MKLNLSIFIILFFALMSCDVDKEEVSKDLPRIENGLIMSATLNGENGRYNIYDRMYSYGVNGMSVAVIDNDSVKFIKGYGHLTNEKKRPVNSKTLFQAASLSKPITCIAVLKLVEAGLLSLDKDVNDYLKNWQIDYSDYGDSTKVTLKLLLSHRSGLSTGGFQGYNSTDSIPSLINILNGQPPANSSPVKLKFKPGSKWSYSGGGYMVIQKIIEDVLGKDFNQAIDSIVLRPLKMENSFFDKTFTDTNKNVALGYNYNKSIVDKGWRIYPELAAAGLWTNPSDLLKFIQAITNSLNEKKNSFLKKRSVDKLLKMGLFLDDKKEPAVFSFRGTNKGYRCEFIGFTKNNQAYGAVVMVNSYNGRYLIQEVLRSIAKQYHWRYPFAGEVKAFNFSKPQKNTLEKIQGSFKYKERTINIKKTDSLLLMTHTWNGRYVYIQPISSNTYIDPTNLSSYKLIAQDSLSVNNKRMYVRVK